MHGLAPRTANRTVSMSLSLLSVPPYSSEATRILSKIATIRLTAAKINTVFKNTFIQCVWWDSNPHGGFPRLFKRQEEHPFLYQTQTNKCSIIHVLAKNQHKSVNQIVIFQRGFAHLTPTLWEMQYSPVPLLHISFFDNLQYNLSDKSKEEVLQKKRLRCL